MQTNLLEGGGPGDHGSGASVYHEAQAPRCGKLSAPSVPQLLSASPAPAVSPSWVSRRSGTDEHTWGPWDLNRSGRYKRRLYPAPREGLSRGIGAGHFIMIPRYTPGAPQGRCEYNPPGRKAANPIRRCMLNIPWVTRRSSEESPIEPLGSAMARSGRRGRVSIMLNR